MLVQIKDLSSKLDTGEIDTGTFVSEMEVLVASSSKEAKQEIVDVYHQKAIEINRKRSSGELTRLGYFREMSYLAKLYCVVEKISS